MPKAPLQVATLASLSDGIAGKCIDAAFSEAANDISTRGHDGKARKIVIEITLTPDDYLNVDIDVQVSAKLPAYRPPSTKAKYSQAAGGFLFNTECASNPDQMTIGDLEQDA